MSAFYSVFGVMSFIAFLVIIFFFGKELLKLQRENKTLRQENEALIGMVPEISSEELENLKSILLDKEDKEECLKSLEQE